MDILNSTNGITIVHLLVGFQSLQNPCGQLCRIATLLCSGFMYVHIDRSSAITVTKNSKI